MKRSPNALKNFENKVASLPKSLISFALSDNKYYKGGFEAKMTRKEAELILGLNKNSNKSEIKEAHKKIMIINHPDKGGSPFIASKLNEGSLLIL